MQFSKYIIIRKLNSLSHTLGKLLLLEKLNFLISSFESNTCNISRSIAIPAISTGVFNYPREMATRVIVETIKEYFLANPDSVIREVYLCDIKTLVVEAFTAALKEKFLNVVEGEGHDQAWKRLKTPHGNLSMDNFIHNKYISWFFLYPPQEKF